MELQEQEEVITTRKVMTKPHQTRFFPLKEPSTWDEDTFSVEFIATSGARVLRGGFWEDPYYEEVNTQGVDLETVPGIPVIIMHNLRQIETVIGRIITARFETGTDGVSNLIVRVAFDKENPDAAEIARKVKAGFLTDVSIGYRETKVVEEGEFHRGLPVKVVENWELVELSVVTVGADSKAKVRSDDAKPWVVETIVKKRVKEPKLEIETTKEPAAKTPGIATGQSRSLAEISEIFTACRSLGIENDKAMEYVQSPQTLDQIRSGILNDLAKKPSFTPTPSIRIDVDERDKIKKSVETAMLYFIDRQRWGGEIEKDELARRMAGGSVLNVARYYLSRSQNMDTDFLGSIQIAERAFAVSSDFPAITLNALNKQLRAQYAEVPFTPEPFTSETTTNNYQKIVRTQLSGISTLDRIPESAEIPRVQVGDAKEEYIIDDYAKIIDISNQALANDDQNAFARIPQLLARASRNVERRLVWSLLLSNLKMSDDKALFDNAHRNIITSKTEGVITIEDISAAWTKMRLQKGLSGEDLDLTPRYLVVPPELQFAAEQLISSEVVPNEPGKLNPMRGRLKVISPIELQTAPTTWYLAATKDEVDIFDLARLSSTPFPQLSSDTAFNRLGISWKFHHVVGAGAIDFRGLVKVIPPKA